MVQKDHPGKVGRFFTTALIHARHSPDFLKLWPLKSSQLHFGAPHHEKLELFSDFPFDRKTYSQVPAVLGAMVQWFSNFKLYQLPESFIRNHLGRGLNQFGCQFGSCPVPTQGTGFFITHLPAGK